MVYQERSPSMVLGLSNSTMLYANCNVISNKKPSTVVSSGAHQPLKTEHKVQEKSEPTHQLQEPEKPQSPVEYLRNAFFRNIYGPAMLANQEELSLQFNRPTREATEAYDMEVVNAIRFKDMDKLRTMLNEGQSFNASNRFGESLIHMACRRGDTEVASFLIKEAGVDVEVRDDFGRTCLHDCCWTSKPNVEMMGLLFNSVSPDMLMAEDVRGHTPFDYARKEHYQVWVDFLKEKEVELQRRITTFGSMR